MGTLTKPPANILELPLAQRAEMALKAAVEKVVEEHMRDGRPLYIWRDGKVIEVSAQETPRAIHTDVIDPAQLVFSPSAFGFECRMIPCAEPWAEPAWANNYLV
jgi:hypothetical protein